MQAARYTALAFVMGCIATMNAYEIKGCLKMSGAVNQLPQLRILFGGKETTTDKDGFYTIPFPGEQAPQRVSLLICQNVLPHFDKRNTMSGYFIKDGESHKCYSLYRPEPRAGWKHTQIQLSAKTPIDPARTIVVLIDPTLVDGLEPWGIVSSIDVLNSPAIKLKSKETKKLALASERSLLSSLDMRPFHETVDYREEKKQKVRLALND